MKFIILVKATADSEAGQMPGEEMIAKMGAFHQELARAGVLVDATGLRPTAAGWRIKYQGTSSTVVDGPFEEANLVAGYTIIDVPTREDAIAWTKRYPNPAPAGKAGEIEVRPYLTLDEFGDSPAVREFRDICPPQKAGAEVAHA